MRRAVLSAAVLAVVLAVAAVAIAQTTQVNTYTVGGSVSPAHPGSKKKPLPVGVKFLYTVGEQSNNRPSPVKKYSIDFYGVRANGKYFPKCSAAQINGDQSGTSDSVCPKGAHVGSGKIAAVVGPSNDVTAKSFTCGLTVDIYNAGAGKGTLWIHRTPADQCPVDTHQAIPVSYVSGPGGSTALEFTVPPELLHQLGLDIAVTSVSSSIKKVTTKVKGKTVGYYESIACKKTKRPIKVTFTSEAGQATPISKDVAC